MGLLAGASSHMALAQVATVCPLVNRPVARSLQSTRSSAARSAASVPLACKASRKTQLRRQARCSQASSCDADAQQPHRPQPKWRSWLQLAAGSSSVATMLAVAPSVLPVLPALLGDGGSGSGSGNDGGGGGGGGGSQPLYELARADDDDDDEEEEEEEEDEEAEKEAGEAAEQGSAAPEFRGDDEDDDESYETAGSKFYCDDVRAEDLPAGQGVPTQDELFSGLKCQPGFEASRADVSRDLQALLGSGLFANVDAKILPVKTPDGRLAKTSDGQQKFALTFKFKQNQWPELKSFKVAPARGKGQLLIPSDVVARVMEERKPGATDVLTLAHIKNIVEGWYQERGFLFGYIANFEGMETGEVVAKLVEGRLARVNVVYLDKSDKVQKAGGQVPRDVILRELSMKEGQMYTAEDGRKALRDIFQLGLFDNVQILPKQSAKDETKIEVDVMVRERPMQTAEVECEWQIAPNDQRRPTLVSLVPGGSITYENRNLGRRARSLTASVSAQNFLAPGEDLGFRMEYKHPYVRGARDPRKTALVASAFNTRKLSGVFTPGPGGEEVPVVYVDRAGVKVALQEQYTRNSRGSLGIVMEQVSTLDETGQLCTHGMRQGPMGMVMGGGPPTTLSDTGADRLVFLQGALTRDTTFFQNSAVIGSRDILQVDQGVGVGTGFPFFNRHLASMTRFIKLRDPPAGSPAPPPVLVLHGRYGGCIGDMASYDYWTLGGPFSVRGYNVGELAACRRFAEGAVELRVPLPKVHTPVYAFYDYGTDLGSSRECRGNPTEYFRRAGSGASWGAGVKLGAVRAELARDCNAGKWITFLRFGERF